MHPEHGRRAAQAVDIVVQSEEGEAGSSHAAGEGLQKTSAWLVWCSSAGTFPCGFGQIILALPSQSLGVGP